MDIIVVLNITATNRFLQDEEMGLPMFKSEGCEVLLVSVTTNPSEGPAAGAEGWVHLASPAQHPTS